jgi:hypothetical protein
MNERGAQMVISQRAASPATEHRQKAL